MELKPCPFCGGAKIWIGTIAECETQDEDYPDYEFNSEHYTVVCDYLEGGFLQWPRHRNRNCRNGTMRRLRGEQMTRGV